VEYLLLAVVLYRIFANWKRCDAVVFSNESERKVTSCKNVKRYAIIVIFSLRGASMDCSVANSAEALMSVSICREESNGESNVNFDVTVRMMEEKRRRKER